MDIDFYMDFSDSRPTSEKEKAEAGCECDDVPRKPRILLGACGSVAAEKFGDVCRLFAEWAEVKAVVTKSSKHFIDEESIPEDVTVHCDDQWQSWEKIGDCVLHIDLCKWADIMVIAPLSANTLGKIAGGLCDNLLTCIVRAWDYEKPFFVAPSMNALMWRNPSKERHCTSIVDLGITLIQNLNLNKEYESSTMAEPSIIYSTVRASYEQKMQKKENTSQV